MHRDAVSSSNLRSVGYDPTEETLEIEFHSGGIYQYYNVPERIYTELLSASSKGSYFATHIKDVYRYRHIR